MNPAVVEGAIEMLKQALDENHKLRQQRDDLLAACKAFVEGTNDIRAIQLAVAAIAAVEASE